MTGEDEGPGDPVQSSGARQGVGSTSRPTRNQTLVNRELGENGLGVLHHVDDVAPWTGRGRAIAGSSCRDELQPTRWAARSMTRRGSAWRRGPVVEEEGQSV